MLRRGPRFAASARIRDTVLVYRRYRTARVVQWAVAQNTNSAHYASGPTGESVLGRVEDTHNLCTSDLLARSLSRLVFPNPTQL